MLVVCNGCSDDTAEVARKFGGPVRVIETEVPSKTHALNLGDASASGFPRIYIDADVVISMSAIRRITCVLAQGTVLAAGPRPQHVFLSGTAWSVRAYYRFWTALPYIQEGMISAGVYALNQEGRARFNEFPNIISDDGFVRLLFRSDERAQVFDATSLVFAPLTLGDLRKIKTRSRFGVLQLRGRYPEFAKREARTKRYRSAFTTVIARPSLYVAVLPYLYVAIASWVHARLQMKRASPYIWQRDDSSRRTENLEV